MITKKNYEVLYYVTPKQYRAIVLDQQQYDPNAMENLNKEEALEELLLKCSLSELISTLIIIFKEKYANPLPVWTGIVDYEINTKKENSKRKDIKKIQFDFKDGVKTDFGGNTEYLDNLFMEFSIPSQVFKDIVKNNLQGKTFTENEQNNKTTFVISNSPISKIEVTPSTFHLFINKSSFIDYGQ
ncbi:hypothetical protein NZD88_13180 [Chryseobacterium antibioticum]|uniref:Uncharacterized protein n=1 Tax=Chryseobacterium pyrolae TaxID=2987481 RepID=A0ABT2IIX6_9FLAO|nr:hypothetical protein [Chryseobacterium pyrolae]MCT2408497.1 hypothetical protein [Chryseobacterium pyrolae]